MTENIRVLVVAGNLLARTGLAALLNEQENIDVVGQIPDGDTFADDLDIYRPDVVVYDPGYEPLSAVPYLNILNELAQPVVILISNEEATTSILPALNEAETYGLLVYESGTELLSTAIVAVIGGLITIDPVLAKSLLPAAANVLPLAPVESLTTRESEVIQLVAQGLTNKAIAQKLNISPNTVKFHLNAILSKLDAQSRTEAVVRATQLGLIVL